LTIFSFTVLLEINLGSHSLNGSLKMKTTITIIPQSETISAPEKIPAGTVSSRAARLGVYEGEPLLVAMDAMIAR
jgi:hypothetical protein